MEKPIHKPFSDEDAARDFEKLRNEVVAGWAREKKLRANSVSERLRVRLEDLMGDRFDKPARVRAGHWQRSKGAWSWQCLRYMESGGRKSYGSILTMAECLKMSDKELLLEVTE
jgi:hypothetical protein